MPIFSESTTAIIANQTSMIREFDIKRIAKLHGVSDKEWDKVMMYYKDPTSSSKESKIQALLGYLNRGDDLAKLLGITRDLIVENLQHVTPGPDIERINSYLLEDGLRFDPETYEIVPIREMPLRTVQEEISILQRELSDLGFSNSLKELEEGLRSLPKDKIGVVTRFRRFLEELIKEIIIGFNRTPSVHPVENRDLIEDLLSFYKPAGSRRSNLRLILDGIYGMLSDLGTHPPQEPSSDELIFLIHVTIEIGLRLLHLFKLKI